jgi:hypothetical protein
MIRFPYMRLTRTYAIKRNFFSARYKLCLQANTADYATGGKIYDDESLVARNHTYRKCFGTGGQLIELYNIIKNI